MGCYVKKTGLIKNVDRLLSRQMNDRNLTMS